MQNLELLIANRKIYCNESDKLFQILFEELKTKIFKEIDNYKATFEKIINSTNYVKLALYLNILESKKDSEDLKPLACEYRNNMKINDSNYSMSSFSYICTDIRESILWFGVDDFLKLLKDNNSIIDSDSYSVLLEECRYKIMRSEYENTIKNQNFDEYYEDYKEDATFSDDELCDELEDLDKFCGFIKDELDYVDETIAHIKWRLKYKDREAREKLYADLERKCLTSILNLIRLISLECKLEIKPLYYSVENYFSFYSDLDKFIRNSNTYSDKQILENMLKFPFESKQYRMVLQKVGDQNLNLSKYCQFWGIDLNSIKETEMQTIVKKCNKMINWKSEESVKDVYNFLVESKGFLGYRNELKIEKELRDILIKFEVEHRTVNGVVYDSLQRAEEVRERSFEGKEYANREEANIVREEVTRIRDSIKNLDFISCYRKYQNLIKQEWSTGEAFQELERINKEIEEEYKRIREESDKESDRRKKMIFSGVSGIIITGLILIFFGVLGIIAFLISGLVVINNYKKWRDCKAAKDIFNALISLDSTKGTMDQQVIEEGGDVKLVTCKSINRSKVLSSAPNNLEFMQEQDYLIKADNEWIESIKKQLNSTRSQKKRQEILDKADLQNIQTDVGKIRVEKLKNKVNQQKPKYLKVKKIYGFSVLGTFVIEMLLIFTGNTNPNILSGLIVIYASFGIYIWAGWSLIVLILRLIHKEDWYLYIKHI